MLGVARWILVPGLVVSWLLLPNTALAIVPQVRDNGKFFDAQTITQANAFIKKIEAKFKKDVAVDTFGEISDEISKRFQYDAKNRDPFFARWVDSLAEGGEIDGVVILIAKDQHAGNKTHIEVGVGRNTQKRAFTLANRTELFNILKQGFGSKQPNQALLDGLRYIETTLSAHQARESAPIAAQNQHRPAPVREADHGAGGSNILGWVCIGVCVLAAIWLVFGLIRAFSGGGGGYAGGPGVGYGGGGGGGGFMSGLMGGLFGAMAGNWLYNNMFGGHQSSWGGSNAYGNETPSAPRDDFGPSDQGQGFSSTGGDVDGGGGGGGDVDGGDGGGGGDWGGGGDAGGDWGGGGGDWGGGGGGGGDW
jgi:TPM domain